MRLGLYIEFNEQMAAREHRIYTTKYLWRFMDHMRPQDSIQMRSYHRKQRPPGDQVRTNILYKIKS